jgi:5-carboxymethyl-2-hydroxymuconate isomerase
MPHCIIDYSEDVAQQVDIESLMEAVHRGAMDSGLFPEYDIKTRANGFAQHRTGQTRDSFVHVVIHLLDGRSDAQKSGLSEGVLARLEPLLPEVVSVGVEICDMHRASYRKRVLAKRVLDQA